MADPRVLLVQIAVFMRLVIENVWLNSFKCFEVSWLLLRILILKSLINKTLRTLLTAVSRGFISSSKDNVLFKGPFFDLRDILAAESPLKMMKIFFYFMLKALFVLKVACRIQIWKKIFCQNSDKFGYSFIKNDIRFM